MATYGPIWHGLTPHTRPALWELEMLFSLIYAHHDQSARSRQEPIGSVLRVYGSVSSTLSLPLLEERIRCQVYEPYEPCTASTLRNV